MKVKQACCYYAYLILLLVLFTFNLRAFAEESGSSEPLIKAEFENEPITGFGKNGGADKKLKDFLMGDGGMMDFVSQAGFILIAFGIGQMILAFKDDNADAKVRGMMFLMGGVFCISIKAILTGLGAVV